MKFDLIKVRREEERERDVNESAAMATAALLMPDDFSLASDWSSMGKPRRRTEEG